MPASAEQDKSKSVAGVRVHYFLLLSISGSISFRLQSMATLKEGDQWQMWEFIPT